MKRLFYTFTVGTIVIVKSLYGIGLNDWQFECQREEIAPVWYVDDKVSFMGEPTLALAEVEKIFQMVNGLPVHEHEL